jgi:hypothetical protein
MLNKSAIFARLFSNVNMPKFNFARKSMDNLDGSLKKEKKIVAPKVKEPKVEIIKEEVAIKISPYFTNAVSEREKSHATINIKDDDAVQNNEDNLKDHKQKLASARRQKDKRQKKIDTMVENIKRELPKE